LNTRTATEDAIAAVGVLAERLVGFDGENLSDPKVVREVQAVARTNLEHRRARPGQQSVSMPGGTATLGLRTQPQFRLLPITYIMSYRGARIASDAVFASPPRTALWVRR